MSQLGADRERARIAAMTERATDSLKQAYATGDPQEITDAVAEFEQILGAAGEPEYPAALINLVNALLVQAEASGSDTALDRALDLFDRHESLFQDDESRLAYLARRGSALLMRAQRSGLQSVMREAVRVQKDRKKLAPKGHPQHGACMLDLGVTLLHSGAMFGSRVDLDEAVAVLEAAKRRPDASVDRAAVLSALGNAWLARFLRVKGRDQAELDAALEEHQQAIDAVTPGDPNSVAYLSDSGAALMRAYEQTGDSRLLVASVEAEHRANEATPPGHVRKAERLNNLSSSLLALYEITGAAETLDEAISTSRAAVAAADPGHAHRTSCLYGLAYGLFRRGELRRTLLDFDEAAAIAGQVVQATPEEHARYALRLAFYAQTLCFLPTAVKLRKTDEELARAARALDHDDPNRAMILSNRGALLGALVGFLGDADTERRQHAAEAVQLTREAVDATPPRHSEYIVRVLNFVVASATLARLDHDPSVLDVPLRMWEAVRNPPGSGVWDTLLELGYADVLACQYDLSGDAVAAAAAIAAYQHGAADSRLSAFRRLEAAHGGAKFAARLGETGPSLELYTLAIDLLDPWSGAASTAGTRYASSNSTRDYHQMPPRWR